MEELTMTREALNKLNKQQTTYCKTLSTLIAIDKKNRLDSRLERDLGDLEGYLVCLQHMELITYNEKKALYLWFSTEDRKNRKINEEE